jgi:3-oxoacyl-[acyl-carrier protein] reductase
MKPLHGKVALITGAGQNIGRAIALHLASLGAAVAVNGRSDRALVDAVVGEIAAAGGRAAGVMGDVSKPAEVDALTAQCVDALGGIDIVISNAGLRRQTPLTDMSFEEWREILSVALDGAFLLAHATVPHLIARGGGRIIALSGISTHVGTPNRCHVSASKAGLEGLMRALAVELAPHAITCNSVAPGAIDTVRGAAAGALPAARGTASGIPLGHKGTVDDIAAAVAYLAGPSGDYVTGQTLHVNGGSYLT